MYLINPKLSNNSLTNDGLNCLIEEIDNKIGDLATIQYLNQIYGLKNFVDLDLYDDLCDYKEILLDILLGCNCFDNDHLIYITSNIQKIINNF